MGITILVIAIIGIVVGVSVKEYLQNKAAQEEALKQTVDFVQEEAIVLNQPAAVEQPETVAPEPVAVEAPKEEAPVVQKPKAKRRYYPKKKNANNKKTQK